MLIKNIPTMKNLKKLCETRWVNRHDSVANFIQLLPALQKSLEAIRDSSDERDVNATCIRLLQSLETPNFIVGLFSVNYIMATVVKLAIILQSKSMDIVRAHDECKRVIENLNTSINDPIEWDEIYGKALTMATSLGVELTRNRGEIGSGNPDRTTSGLYRNFIFKHAVESLTQDFSTRLSKRERLA